MKETKKLQYRIKKLTKYKKKKIEKLKEKKISNNPNPNK
jgi:hypothetical protein